MVVLFVSVAVDSPLDRLVLAVDSFRDGVGDPVGAVADHVRQTLLQTGLVREQMEDKWFIYWRNDRLFFHCSWTGYCIYVVRFEIDGGGQRMVEAILNRDATQYGETDDDHDAKMINYLIDVLLLEKPSEFPSEETDPEKLAILQWSQVGDTAIAKDALAGSHEIDNAYRCLRNKHVVPFGARIALARNALLSGALFRHGHPIAQMT